MWHTSRWSFKHGDDADSLETLYETTLTVASDTDVCGIVYMFTKDLLYISAVDYSARYTALAESDTLGEDCALWESFDADTYALVEITDDIDEAYYKWVVNVYFQYDPNTYDIILNPNSDEFLEDEYIIMKDLEYYTSYTLPANTYTRDGRTFGEWNTEADGSGTSYADEATVRNLTTEDGAIVTLYAQWTYVYAADLTMYKQSTSETTSRLVAGTTYSYESSEVSGQEVSTYYRYFTSPSWTGFTPSGEAIVEIEFLARRRCG